MPVIHERLIRATRFVPEDGDLHLDPLDIRIFCEMGYKYYNYAGTHRRPSPSQIANKLGLDEKTVRLRTRRMEREGFIEYYQAIPNLRLFGRPLAVVGAFDAGDLKGKQHALELLQGTPDIIDIADFLGTSFVVTVAAASDADADMRLRRIAEAIRLSSGSALPIGSFPLPQLAPDKLDWQLVKALRYNALRPTEAIAQELNITYRMAEYRIGRLLAAQVLCVRAMINARDPKGIVFYGLTLAIDEARRERIVQELRNAYHERIWLFLTPPVPTIIVNLFGTSVGEAEDHLLDALARPGVQGGALSIWKRWVEPTRPNWIDKLLEEKIAAR